MAYVKRYVETVDDDIAQKMKEAETRRKTSLNQLHGDTLSDVDENVNKMSLVEDSNTDITNADGTAKHSNRFINEQRALFVDKEKAQNLSGVIGSTSLTAIKGSELVNNTNEFKWQVNPNSKTYLQIAATLRQAWRLRSKMPMSTGVSRRKRSQQAIVMFRSKRSRLPKLSRKKPDTEIFSVSGVIFAGTAEAQALSFCRKFIMIT